MADIVNFYQNDVVKYVKQPYVEECMNILKKYNFNGNLDSVINYARTKF